MATQTPVTISPLEQPLTYKTWVLKVSIHCEGCKRKVKKVLHTIEGVYTVNVDTKQQKAIVTGNVEAGTLIKKLVKSGKHAEMWPETPDQQRDKSNKSKKKDNKDKDTDSESSAEERTGGAGAGSHGCPNSQKQAVKFEVVHGGDCGAPAKTSEGGGGTVRFSDGGAKIGGGVAAETRSEGKKPETGTSGNHPPPAETKASESDGGAEKSSGGSGSGSGTGSGSGSGGKKKKKKGHHKSATEGGPSSGGAPASTGSGNRNAGPPAGNHSPPRHQGHQYPPTTAGPLHYYTTPQPVYVASYNTAHPTSSYTASYYASPPGYSYAHTCHGPEMEPPPFDLDYHPRQPLDSFELFSDENPNGCSVM